MSQSEDLKLLPYLQQALDSPVGIELAFLSEEEMKRFRAKLVALRAKHEEYKTLAFLDMGDRLWLVKKDPDGISEAHVLPT